MRDLKFGPPVFVTSISEKLRTDLLLNIKLYETERNLAEYGDFMMS